MQYRILIFLLLTIPFSFKLEIFGGFRFLIQEPFILLFTIICNLKTKSVKLKALPFLFLGFSLTIIFFSSCMSLFQFFDPFGTIKILKYLLYTFAVLTVLNNPMYIDEFLIKKIMNIGFVTIFLTLAYYIYSYIEFGKSWTAYVSYSTWNHEYMPTGLSNLAFDFSDLSFKRVGGNHGIYGSYLVLLLILAFSNVVKTAFKKSKLLILIILINLSFITSREAILLLILTILFYALNYFLTKKSINQKIVLVVLVLVVGFGAIIIWNPNVVIVHKINHMLSSFKETGGFDRGVNMRFNTWYLFFKHLISHPWVLLIGVGYNITNFDYILSVQEKLLQGSFIHVDKAESFYVSTLAYGGLFSLIFGLLFFMTLIYILYKMNKRSRVISFFVMGLVVTNTTGSSVLAELLLSQLGLVCAIVLKYPDNKMIS